MKMVLPIALEDSMIFEALSSIVMAEFILARPSEGRLVRKWTFHTVSALLKLSSNLSNSEAGFPARMDIDTVLLTIFILSTLEVRAPRDNRQLLLTSC